MSACPLRTFMLCKRIGSNPWCDMSTPFYRKRFKEAGIEPGDIKTLSDVTKLPFTKKSPGRITAMLWHSAAPDDLCYYPLGLD